MFIKALCYVASCYAMFTMHYFIKEIEIIFSCAPICYKNTHGEKNFLTHCQGVQPPRIAQCLTFKLMNYNNYVYSRCIYILYTVNVNTYMIRLTGLGLIIILQSTKWVGGLGNRSGLCMATTKLVKS